MAAEGETIARKILREDEFAGVRPKLARQLGAVLASIHGLPHNQLPGLRRMTAAKELDELERDYRSLNWPKPVFELALRWLRDRDPGPVAEMTPVHGDFSATAISSSVATAGGRCLIGNSPISTIPMEDLGWVCVNSWRFGEIDKPVGGLGSREELFEGYEAAGRRVDAARVKFWEVMGTLCWGLMCGGMMHHFRLGPDHSMERAMIGRRASETEIDLMRLLAPRGS